MSINNQQYEEQMSLLRDKSLKVDQRVTADQKNEIMSNDDLIKMLKVSRRTANQWRTDGLIPFYKVGHKVFYLLHDVKEFILKHKPASDASVRSN